MNIEAVSEMDLIENISWNEEAIARWNGRDLNTVHGKHHEDRISSVALQRARFDNAQTGYILCKNEKDSSSKSASKGSDDKSSNSSPNSDKSDDKKSKSDVKQSVSMVAGYDKDNHGHSSNKALLKYNAKFQFENGTSLDLTGSGSWERNVNRNELSDRTSGEIDASFNF